MRPYATAAHSDLNAAMPLVSTWRGDRPINGHPEHHMLILWEAGATLHLTGAQDAGPGTFPARHGELSFLPAGSRQTIEALRSGAAAILVGLPHALLDRAACTAWQPRLAASGRHPRTADAIRWLAHRRVNGPVQSPLVDLLLARLAATAFCGMVRRPDDAWLPPATLQRIDDLARSGGPAPTLATVASLAGLGVSAFSRGFRGSTGITPGEFLVGVRMDAVADLLTSTELPLPDVARAVGMSSVAHANQQFRARHGVSLSRYRMLRAAARGAPAAETSALEAYRELAKTDR